MAKLDDLEELGRLRAEGTITELEFGQRKQSLLGGSRAHASPSPREASHWPMGLGILALFFIAIVVAQVGLRSRTEDRSDVAGVEQVDGAGRGDAGPNDPLASVADVSDVSTFDGVQPGEDYTVSRNRFIALGLRPAKISRGDEYDLCDLAHCPPFPEAVSCSGTGVNECRFAFVTANGRFLIATTVGEGDNPALDRVGWASDNDARQVKHRIAGRPAMRDDDVFAHLGHRPQTGLARS